jgi:hypothetical protein
MNVINNSLVNADVPGKRLAFVPFTLTNSPGKIMQATNGGRLHFHPLQLNNTERYHSRGERFDREVRRGNDAHRRNGEFGGRGDH